MPERVTAMAPLVLEALRFGIRNGVLQVNDGRVKGLSTRTPQPGNLRILTGKAAFVGRWLAKTNQPSTVFALLGVQL
jgi:hypothetical protein